MRKLRILIPSILVASTIPMVSVVGCNDNHPVEKVLVQFNTNGGSHIDAIQVEVGTVIDPPTNPTKTGYDFVNWYDDEDCTEGNEHDFSKPVNDNITIYAKWTEHIVHVTSVNITEDNIVSWTNETPYKKVGYTISPAGATDQSVTWTVGDESIATVSNDGTITPIKNGTTTITVTTNDGGLTDACSLEVKTHAKQISIDQGDKQIAYVGYDNRTLTCVISPEETSTTDVEWESSDKSVATINNNGEIHSIKAGTTTITATTTDGTDLSDSCELTVYDPEPLCFEKDGTTSDPDPTIGYTKKSLDVGIVTSTDGTNWVPWDGAAITLESGKKLYVKNTINTLSQHDLLNYFSFQLNGNIKASGYVDSLINYSDLTPYCYWRLFENEAGLTNASLFLPATCLAAGCYTQMFYGCSFLKTAPQLPATTLSENCYFEMFRGCSSLETPPQLPATTLADECYTGMFCNCSSLTSTPELPAEELFDYCYCYMFENCSSLTHVPSLPATTLANSCYSYMFENCGGLAIDKDWFYSNIFNKDNISFAPDWAYCMFLGTYEGEDPFILPDSDSYVLTPYCFAGLNAGLNVASVSTNYLPWTELAVGCYDSMFYACEDLETAPELPATTLAEGCYKYMFYDCEWLSISENESLGGEKIFTCPTNLPEDAVEKMFYGTYCDFEDGTPAPGYSYYWYTE